MDSGGPRNHVLDGGPSCHWKFHFLYCSLQVLIVALSCLDSFIKPLLEYLTISWLCMTHSFSVICTLNSECSVSGTCLRFSFGAPFMLGNTGKESTTNKKLECGPMPSVMATLPNIGGTLYRNSLNPLLVPPHKVWLTTTARVLCNHITNIEECKSWTQSEFCTWKNSLRGQEPQKMYI